MLNSVRDVLVTVAQRQQTGGWFGRWTILPEEFHRDNVLLVTVCLAKGLIRFNGACFGLRLTRRGRAVLSKIR